MRGSDGTTRRFFNRLRATRVGELKAVKGGVEAVADKKLLVGSLFDQLPFV